MAGCQPYLSANRPFLKPPRRFALALLSAGLAEIRRECNKVREIHLAIAVEIPDQPGRRPAFALGRRFRRPEEISAVPERFRDSVPVRVEKSPEPSAFDIQHPGARRIGPHAQHNPSGCVLESDDAMPVLIGAHDRHLIVVAVARDDEAVSVRVDGEARGRSGLVPDIHPLASSDLSAPIAAMTPPDAFTIRRAP